MATHPYPNNAEASLAWSVLHLGLAAALAAGDCGWPLVVCPTHRPTYFCYIQR
jgi:hypothetical protein